MYTRTNIESQIYRETGASLMKKGLLITYLTLNYYICVRIQI